MHRFEGSRGAGHKTHILLPLHFVGDPGDVARHYVGEGGWLGGGRNLDCGRGWLGGVCDFMTTESQRQWAIFLIFRCRD